MLKSKHSLLFLSECPVYIEAMPKNTFEDQQRLALSMRIKEAIDSQPRGAKVRISESCGVSPTAITGWIKNGRIDKKNIEILAKMTGYNLHWLISGNGEKRVIENINNSQSRESTLDQPLYSYNLGKLSLGRIPLLSWSNAGEWRPAIENGSFEMIGVTEIKVGLNTFALKVEGDSMEPEFKAGETIIIEPDLEAKPGNFVIVMIAGEAVLRQLWKEPGEELELRVLDKRYQPRPLADNKIIGTVIAITLSLIHI